VTPFFLPQKPVQPCTGHTIATSPAGTTVWQQFPKDKLFVEQQCTNILLNISVLQQLPILEAYKGILDAVELPCKKGSS